MTNDTSPDAEPRRSSLSPETREALDRQRADRDNLRELTARLDAADLAAQALLDNIDLENVQALATSGMLVLLCPLHNNDESA